MSSKFSVVCSIHFRPSIFHTTEKGLRRLFLYAVPKLRTSISAFKSACSLLFYVTQLSSQVLAGTQFASHVSINTPARSFSHGVGDPVSLLARRSYPQPLRTASRHLRRPPAPAAHGGYPRMRPAIPFFEEEARHDNSLGYYPWQQNNYMDVSIPVLPPSPYKVDSPDPESLWPEGLFVPPRAPSFRPRSDTGEVLSEAELLDPYLLEGSEAIAAVSRASRHGLLYFHDIPHIESLLMNQELRKHNKLKPHRLGSIRHTWPYYRP